MPTVFIGVGSNLGDRKAHFDFAKAELQKSGLVRDLKHSPVYETAPLESEGGKYLNAVWIFETALGPSETLELLRGIETRAGRPSAKSCRRTTGEGKTLHEARPLDLDLLFYGDEVLQTQSLTVPHPRIPERAFVLMPLCDLVPELQHPVLKKSIRKLLADLCVTDNGQSATKTTRLFAKR